MKLLGLYGQKENKMLTVLKSVLPLSFVFKTWFLAELEYNQLGIMLGEVWGRILTYLLSGVVAYVLAILAVSFSYGSFYRSKYSPCDEMSNCLISRQTYTSIAYFAIVIANILCGIFNFVACFVPISISFIIWLFPTITSLFAVVSIIVMLNIECGKGEFKQLMTAMAWPSILLLLLLR